MRSPLAYIGGKSKLAPRIIEMIPEHITYCEPFTGGGWVFFGKEPSKCEVINDLDGDLVAFYRVLQYHLEEFVKQFKWLVASRDWWHDWNDQLKGRGLTEIQKAARYYYVQRLCFGSRVKGRTFGTGADRKPRINLLRLEEELSEMHLRLARVMIENVSYEKILQTYDKTTTFFYFDPPYYKAPFYKHNFLKLEDYQEMRERLKKIKGRFILSINDCPEIRKVFTGFIIKPVTLAYTIAKEGHKKAKELIVSNF